MSRKLFDHLASQPPVDSSAFPWPAMRIPSDGLFTHSFCGVQREPVLDDEQGAVAVVKLVFGDRLAFFPVQGAPLWVEVRTLPRVTEADARRVRTMVALRQGIENSGRKR